MKPQRFRKQHWPFVAERKMHILFFVKKLLCDEFCLAISFDKPIKRQSGLVITNKSQTQAQTQRIHAHGRFELRW